MPSDPSYAVLTSRRRRRLTEPFRTVRLNVVGWSALLAVAGVPGGAVFAVTGRPWAALVVPGLVLVMAVVLDRLRWRNSWIGMGVDSVEQAEQVVAALAGRGVEARAESNTYVSEDGQMVDDHRVMVRQRDGDAVRQSLSQLDRRGTATDQDGPST